MKLPINTKILFTENNYIALLNIIYSEGYRYNSRPNYNLINLISHINTFFNFPNICFLLSEDKKFTIVSNTYVFCEKLISGDNILRQIKLSKI